MTGPEAGVRCCASSEPWRGRISPNAAARRKQALVALSSARWKLLKQLRRNASVKGLPESPLSALTRTRQAFYNRPTGYAGGPCPAARILGLGDQSVIKNKGGPLGTERCDPGKFRFHSNFCGPAAAWTNLENINLKIAGAIGTLKRACCPWQQSAV